MKIYLKIMMILGAACIDNYGASDIPVGDGQGGKEEPSEISNRVRLEVAQAASACAEGGERSSTVVGTGEPLPRYPAFNRVCPTNTDGSGTHPLSNGEFDPALGDAHTHSGYPLASEGASTVGDSEAEDHELPDDDQRK